MRGLSLPALTPSIFLRYAIVSDADLAEGVAKLARQQG